MTGDASVVPHFVHLNSRMKNDYRRVMLFLCHYGDTNGMFLLGGLDAAGETPHAVVAMYLKELGGLILNHNKKFYLVKVVEHVINYDTVNILLCVLDYHWHQCYNMFRCSYRASNMVDRVTTYLTERL